MPSYHTLDTIADAVNPTLGVLALLLAWLSPAGRQWGPIHFLAGISTGVVLAYLLRYVDQQFHLWRLAGFDYSTHTAIAMVLLVPLGMLGRKYGVAAVVVGVAYAGLMVYQKYHSVADIVTTAAVIALPAWWVHRMLRR